MIGGTRSGRGWLPANRLFVHDFQIAACHLRANVSSFGDGLTILVSLAAVVAAARYGIFSLPPLYRLILVSVAGSVTAPYIYYVLVRRVAFFRSNSVLADVALDKTSTRQYVFAIAMIACVAIIVALLAPDVSLMANFFASFCISLLVALLLSKAFSIIFRRISYHKQERLDEILASRHFGKGRLSMALCGGMSVFAAAAFLDVPVAASIATFTSLALCLWYAPIAYSAIEYERLVGLSPIFSLRTRVRNAVLIGSAVAVGAGLSMQWQIVGVVVAVFALLLLYKGLEVLIVRAVGGGKAQISMVMILLVLTSVAVVLPFLALILVPACAVWLLTKGRRRTWQLS